MASAIIVAPVVNANPDLSLEQLQYDDNGVWTGGWSCLGQVPTEGTCMVRVWCSDAQLDTLAADARYLVVEVLDGE
jgi:hypothetical protein